MSVNVRVKTSHGARVKARPGDLSTGTRDDLPTGIPEMHYRTAPAASRASAARMGREGVDHGPLQEEGWPGRRRSVAPAPPPRDRRAGVWLRADAAVRRSRRREGQGRVHALRRLDGDDPGAGHAEGPRGQPGLCG